MAAHKLLAAGPLPAILAPIPIATCPSWLLLPVGAHRYTGVCESVVPVLV